MQQVHPPLSRRKLWITALIVALIAILSITESIHTAVTFNPADTFAAPTFNSTTNFAYNNSYTEDRFESLFQIADSLTPKALHSPYPRVTLPAPISTPTSTVDSKSETIQLSKGTDTVFLVVCFTAVLVAVSLMIVVVELNSDRRRKATL